MVICILTPSTTELFFPPLSISFVRDGSAAESPQLCFSNETLKSGLIIDKFAVYEFSLFFSVEQYHTKSMVGTVIYVISAGDYTWRRWAGLGWAPRKGAVTRSWKINRRACARMLTGSLIAASKLQGEFITSKRLYPPAASRLLLLHRHTLTFTQVCLLKGWTLSTWPLSPKARVYTPCDNDTLLSSWRCIPASPPQPTWSLNMLRPSCPRSRGETPNDPGKKTSSLTPIDVFCTGLS